MASFKPRKKNPVYREKNRFNSEQRTTLILVGAGVALNLLVGLIPVEQRNQFLIIAGGICSGAIGYLSRKENEQPSNPYSNHKINESEQDSDY